ncbi:DNA repair protein RecN [Limnohabitans sp. TS-CS-82]|uniref:DNA repair protein RecN n=1 Tax=Limnohabitans sp. TS-CS-82 TaxID=2094193 RepID=UPI000CF267BB|nr:DNA repair protein RecN [Limnohabitans sp. TS-CS-82]PQA79720.1 DNA repair protein RecN [Limnohabitans sp. TS-CS-82]
MSLQHIVLRDFVIVRELDLDLSSGFSALTGETGAGKSILIDALQLVLGARAESSVVREGAARAEICAEFDTTPEILTWLDDEGFADITADDHLLLKRTIDAQGKSRAWINGSPATATQLRALGDRVLDIHGQHAWQSLTRPDAVRGLLDAYAGVNLQGLTQTWTQWRQATQALHEARTAQATLQEERERLLWQIAEVDKLAPAEDEWDELNRQHTRLSNAQALMDAAQAAIQALEDDDSGALRLLTKAQDTLQDQTDVEPEFTALVDVLASSLAQAGDVAHSLNAYLGRTELDPARLQTLDDRMSLWMSLARRFKRTPQELPALYQEWKNRLTQLDVATDLEALEATEAKAAAAYQTEARKISQARTQAAPKLATAITQAMQGLGMQGGRFEVQLDKTEQPTASGLESITFLVAGHPGSTPRPVGKVASGGELSRIALAIAVTTSELGTAQTLIFDEVDSGVGGAVAETVGRLMKQLGIDRQVLAVTHLPQVAACADHHLVVSKQSDAQGTSSQVTALSADARVNEIARMLGGEKVSDTTLAHAREMLQTSAKTSKK